MRTTYTWRDGQFVDKATGEPMPVRDENAICRPYICSDIKPYRSPIDGRVITSRSERREDLIRNNCVEYDPPSKPRTFKNPRFAKKRGLPLDPEIAARMDKDDPLRPKNV